VWVGRLSIFMVRPIKRDLNIFYNIKLDMI